MEERLYDLIFIARPATAEEDMQESLSSGRSTPARKKAARWKRPRHWGTRKLAYRVAKHREGIYLLSQIRTFTAD